MLKKIFEPIQINTLTLDNRLIVPAMATNYSNAEGLATEKLIAYHEAKARGGWGLIITEDYRILPEAGASPNLPGLYSDEQIMSHRQLTERIHKAGGKIVAQIYHAGWESKRSFTGHQPVSAVASKNCNMDDMAKALTIEQIEAIIQAFADCAKRVKLAGFDGVEIHGAHGYLLEQFFSPIMNCRADAYGGDLAGRAKLALEVVKAVRQAVGPEFPILYRMTVAEYVEGGLGIEESKALAIMLEDAGVDAINCSQGSGSMGRGELTIAPSIVRPAAYVGHAQAIKSVVDIPVIAVGRINTPEIAEAVIRSGQADLVAMGRASIADPQLPNKAKQGKLTQINHCIGCVQGCIGEKRRGNAMSCLVNPYVGRESEIAILPASETKKVYIVGGGVAGCEAAIAAASKGHQVTLFEKTDRLGGQWLLAAVPIGKSEFASFIKWQKEQMDRLGVVIHLQTPLTAEILQKDRPDILIVATGSHPAIAPIKGVEQPWVVTAHDILSGSKQAGRRVVIIGGGLVGAETAEFLAYHGSDVTILEALPQIAKDGEHASNLYMMNNLNAHQVKIYTSAQVSEIGDHMVTFVHQEQTHRLAEIDTIVMATGLRSDHEIDDILSDTDIKVVKIGDAAKVKNGLANIREGFDLGINL